MRRDIFGQFDRLMANLKPVEPSSGFDFEFRRRLDAAIQAKLEETALERLVRRASERVKEALIPKVPALARVTVTAVLLMALGAYIYSVQPAGPFLTRGMGTVLARSAKDASWKEISPGDKLKTGDVIITKKGGRIDIKLPGKYTVRLKESSSLRIARLTPRYGKGRALFELAEGTALIDIRKGFKGSEFAIKTETATATALGTKFAVNVSEKEKAATRVSVLEGKVRVKSSHAPERITLAKQIVTVGPGQKTEVFAGSVPLPPQRLAENELRRLEELYGLGRKPQVALLIKNTPERVRELLKPCAIMISDEKPKEFPDILEKALLKTKEALETKDAEKHLESVRLLEKMTDEYPDPEYDAQLLLYIGAYYEYLGEHQKAIEAFKKVPERYPDSTLSSLAECAIGVIYDEKLNDTDKAKRAYEKVLKDYPDSPEAVWVKNEKASMIH